MIRGATTALSQFLVLTAEKQFQSLEISVLVPGVYRYLHIPACRRPQAVVCNKQLLQYHPSRNLLLSLRCWNIAHRDTSGLCYSL